MAGAGHWFRGKPAGECFGFVVQRRSGEIEVWLLETRRLLEIQCVRGGIWVGVEVGVFEEAKEPGFGGLE